MPPVHCDRRPRASAKPKPRRFSTLALSVVAAAAALGAFPVSAEARAAVAATEPRTTEAAARVLRWIAKTHDNGQLPYAVIDKQAARVLLFDPQGNPIGESAALIGSAKGDDSSPGVGSKPLAELGPAEKTTPAGRFLARFGNAAGNKRVLWIDYDVAVALHPVVTSNRRERRLQRLSSPTARDNRITFGCVNVPAEFYDERIRPLFNGEGGVVYVLPDSMPVEEVFPALYTERYF